MSFGILLVIIILLGIIFAKKEEDLTPPANKAEWKEWYSNIYLQSRHWRKRRNRSLVLANFRCEECSYNRNLQVHHLTYKNLGNENDGDLEVLCRKCHRKVHHLNWMKNMENIFKLEYNVSIE